MNIHNKIFLAPCAGFTDTAFRRVCKNHGADIVCSEMISTEALSRNSKKTMRLLSFREIERPIGIQLFGSNETSIAKAVELVNELKPDFLDFNFGCSVKKINRANSGSILLKDLDKISSIVKTLKKYSISPVSAKIRLGYEEKNGIEIAKTIEDAGADFIIVHGRTAKQKFTEQADWQAIAEIKKNTGIPVVGNGGLFEPSDIYGKWKESKVDAIMIGRAAFYNPFIFNQIKEYVSKGRVLTESSYSDKIELINEHCRIMQEENMDVRQARKHFHCYIKGLKCIKRVREKVNKMMSYEDMKEIAMEIGKYQFEE